MNWFDSYNSNYNQVINSRQIQMIAIGGAIGSGLFLGTGARLRIAGPALAITYFICGVFCFFILRALGELILYRPSSGSFVSYTREFIGEKGSYIAGWMYFINWAMTGIVDITAAALYIHYWRIFSSIPQWILALAVLIIVTFINLASVKWFAEIEYWFALIKVVAIIAFLIIGVLFLSSGRLLDGNVTGLHLISENGGIFPHGIFCTLVLTQGVVFAFAAIEMIGVAAGECTDPKSIIPKAVNSIIWRIILFYVGSIVLLVLLLPYNSYQDNQSPFVTFFSKIGIPYTSSIMNLIVLSATISSLNSGLYTTARILYTMSINGSAPKILSKMSKKQVPYVGIIATVLVYIIGVYLNYIVPSKIFEMVLNIASLGVISSWFFILLCQIKLREAIKSGNVKEIQFKLPGGHYTSWSTIIFLGVILILMAFDYPNGTLTIASIPFLAIILIIGWFGVRKKCNLQM